MFDKKRCPSFYFHPTHSKRAVPTCSIIRKRYWQIIMVAIALGIMMFYFTLQVLHTTAASLPITPTPNQPSIVTTKGTQLIVQKRKADNTLGEAQPYTIKGVNWSPASIGTELSQLPGEFGKWYAIDIPLMKKMGVNTVRTFWDFGTGVTATQILDTFYDNDIMVIMIVDQANAVASNITTTVNAYKNHPAILMWAIGNEWDINHYYGQYTNTVDAALFTEWAAQIVHSLDGNHPVASILGDIYRGSSQPLLPLLWKPDAISTQEIVNDLVPSVDVWGVNAYRGATFGGLFGQWQQISNKPIFVSEFGADSYDHRIAAENQQMQADFDETLWWEINLFLSSRSANNPALGGLVFEWDDEWWKNGDPNNHDVTNETNPGQPDGYNDEEWFGLVDINRQPKEAFYRMQWNFLSLTNISRTIQITTSAFSEGYSQFFKDTAGFCYKAGGGGGGRGINIAVINSNSGAIEDCRNFDTYYDKQAFVTMTEYISNSNDIASGRIVLAAIADEAGFIRNPLVNNDCHTPYSDSRVETGYKALENLGSNQIRNVGFWGSWAMIAIKGQGALAEDYHDPMYAPPSSNYCQMDNRVFTQVTATLPVSVALPFTYLNYLPVALR